MEGRRESLSGVGARENGKRETNANIDHIALGTILEDRLKLVM
jgi:hypothetical protein